MSPEGSSYLSVLYNGMVHPFTIFPVKGVIWYQGEANVKPCPSVFPSFSVADSRLAETIKQELPFYFVQLANYLRSQEIQPDSKWAALREAQSDALSMEGTGMYRLLILV